MTTHVFIVDDNTFRYHLEYLFAGTGAKEKAVDFNNTPNSKLHHSTEAGLVEMMADGCRVRKDDLIIFYVQSSGIHEGKFYGIFQATDDCIFIDNYDTSYQFLLKELKKSLTFRLKIKPYEVYAEGVTEWAALDEIKNICSPYQMLWSLIYRKLKGNRGNTMITIYEAERLISLIRNKNNNIPLDCAGRGLTYKDEKITTDDNIKTYTGRQENINILPRLISKHNAHLAYEAHLQMYITQNIGRGTNPSLDAALGVNGRKIEWIGNEVSCGVGMQRIDIMISIEENATKRIVMPIELKAVAASTDNTRQLTRYVDWIEQYYIPNRISIIQPVLLCKKEMAISKTIIECFNKFNSRNGIQPLKYIEYEVSGNQLKFNSIIY